MENDSDNKLNYKQIQELLPDYAFGRLDDETSDLFEFSIIHYPDLQVELKEIQEVFGKVEAMNFDSIIEGGSKNLSVKIQNRLSKTEPKRNGFAFLTRMVIPTLGLAAIVFVLIMTGITKDKTNVQTGTQSSSKIENIINSAETMVLLESDNELSGTELASISSRLSPNLKDELEIMLNDDIIEDKESILRDLLADLLMNANNINDKTVYERILYIPSFLDDFDYLDEDDFQQLLEALENANYPT